jgi:carboxyl-terminal processing protease
MNRFRLRKSMTAALCAGALALAGCGGGEEASRPPPPPASCSVGEQNRWLADYMNEWYFWYRLSPRPDPAPYTDVAGFFNALLYTGSDTRFPTDRWSYNEPTESFNRFYGDGATLGYGMQVSGVEAVETPGQPLWVRGVEPGSPAALAGVQRGDQVMAVNGRAASDIIAANDFAVLTPTRVGEVLTVRLVRSRAERTVTLTAAVHNLVPVGASAVFVSPGGRRLGYLPVKNMISQALAPMETAFARFKAEGVNELVLDLRYNGGGLVSTGRTLASYVAGLRGDGRAYASLLYNDKRSASNNERYAFESRNSSLGLARVFVLTGPRTCSAAEQVINGLRGVGVQVVSIGDTTCGKPVGFLPASSCGQTYSVVNFEAVNDRNEGRYFDGFDASCPVAENFQVPQGDRTDPLVATASALADGAQCPTLSASASEGRRQALSARRAAKKPWLSDERSDMIAR